MSENITITDGVKQPWELPGTDYDKPEDIILANLAMGQLAFIGSIFGKYINTQAMVTAELAEAVEKVKARSAEVSSLFADWKVGGHQLDLDMPATGGYPADPSIVDLDSTTPSPVDKLVKANNLIAEYGLANRSVPPLYVNDLVRPYQTSCTYTFGPTPDGKTITGFSPVLVDDSFPNIPDFLLFAKRDSSGQVDKSKVFVKFNGAEYEATNFKMMWVPSSSADIDYFNKQLALVDSARSSRLLSDTTQLVPVPSEVNADSSGADANQPAKITMEVSLGQADFIEFKLDRWGFYYYYEKPAAQIPLYDEKTVSNYVGTVVKMPDGKYAYIVDTVTNQGIEYIPVGVTPTACLKSPTDLQKSDILSKYSDKIVRITQRSTEQGNYVTALVQRYNYSFEAATNILKAFTNLGSTLVSNI